MSVIGIRRKFKEKIIPDYLRASGVIPVLAYNEPDCIFLMDDKTIGFAFLCQPVSYADQKMQDRMTGLLNQEFPTGTLLQYILFRSPDINRQMYEMLAIRGGHRSNQILSTVIKERVDFLRKHTMESITSHGSKGHFDNGLIQDLKLIVTCKIPIASSTPTEDEIDAAKELRVKIEAGLQVLELRPLTMTAAMYIRTTGTMLNWGEGASWFNDATGWDTDRPICEQIYDYDTDIGVSRDGLTLGDNCHVKVLSAKKLPDQFFFGDAIRYIGDLSGGNSSIKENYMVVTNIFYPDPEKTKNRLEAKRHMTINQAYGPLVKFVPVLADKKEGFDILYDSMKEGAKPCQVSYSMVIFAPTDERAHAAATGARNIWREFRFELMEDKLISLPMFINCLPLCTDQNCIRELFRYKTMTTEHAAALVPILGEWKGTGTFHASLLSRNGQLMSLSLHDSSTNKNLVIAAESGSGKSFLTNEMIMAYLSEGAQIWVIDAGKSYHKLCDVLDGDFVQFDEGANICINPFSLINNYEDEEDAIVSLVSSMASSRGALDEWQISCLKQVLSRLWNAKGSALSVDDIAEACSQGEDIRMRDIGTQLFAFTSKGSYGKYFSGVNNMAFDKQFTVLELDELQGRKHLRQVVLLQLIYQIQQTVYLGDRQQKKLVIIDEAWDLLKDGEVSVFMEAAYRKFRKFNSSVAIATQSINDLYENPVGRAIAENSASMYLLGQTEEAVESVKRSGRLTLPDAGFRLLKTVHTIAGVYSEIFIKTKVGIGIGRLIVGDFQKLLYSTDPVDVNAIQCFQDKGYSVTEAIYAVIRDRNGVGE